MRLLRLALDVAVRRDFALALARGGRSTDVFGGGDHRVDGRRRRGRDVVLRMERVLLGRIDGDRDGSALARLLVGLGASIAVDDLEEDRGDVVLAAPTVGCLDER